MAPDATLWLTSSEARWMCWCQPMPSTGGTGLHVAPAGAAVAHLDATWTPAAHEQAECRLHRYSTVRDVLNDHPLCWKDL